MCPVCIATAALIAGKAASTGGLAALAFRRIRHKTVKPVASASAVMKKTVASKLFSTEPRASASGLHAR
jgi:hypothetical protein